MTNNSEINKHLKEFGLNPKEIKIYLALLQKTSLTPLELSRITNINRASVYRNLEKLQQLGLVKEIIGHKTTSFQASPPENLKLLVAQKEIQLSQLQQSLNPLISNLSNLVNNTTSPTKILYYRGEEGIKQLLWNLLSAKTEHVGYGYLDWNYCVGEKYAEKIRQEHADRNIHIKEISNNNTDSKIFTKNSQFLSKYQERYLPKSKLEINHDTYIYNNVFAFLNIYNNEPFGIEIHNAEIAKTQRQIFYLLWDLAQTPI